MRSVECLTKPRRESDKSRVSWERIKLVYAALELSILWYQKTSALGLVSNPAQYIKKINQSFFSIFLNDYYAMIDSMP